MVRDVVNQRIGFFVAGRSRKDNFESQLNAFRRIVRVRQQTIGERARTVADEIAVHPIQRLQGDGGNGAIGGAFIGVRPVEGLHVGMLAQPAGGQVDSAVFVVVVFAKGVVLGVGIFVLGIRLREGIRAYA